MLNKILDSEVGAIIISIVLGFGLAAVFKQVCKGSDCLVIKGPNMDDVNKYYYKIDEDCFKYKPIVTKCDTDKADRQG